MQVQQEYLPFRRGYGFTFTLSDHRQDTPELDYPPE